MFLKGRQELTGAMCYLSFVCVAFSLVIFPIVYILCKMDSFFCVCYGGCMHLLQQQKQSGGVGFSPSKCSLTLIAAHEHV